MEITSVKSLHLHFKNKQNFLIPVLSLTVGPNLLPNSVFTDSITRLISVASHIPVSIRRCRTAGWRSTAIHCSWFWLRTRYLSTLQHLSATHPEFRWCVGIWGVKVDQVRVNSYHKTLLCVMNLIYSKSCLQGSPILSPDNEVSDSS